MMERGRVTGLKRLGSQNLTLRGTTVPFYPTSRKFCVVPNPHSDAQRDFLLFALILSCPFRPLKI